MFTSYPSITDPLVHTYSIVARDPHSGQLGVAVQSHYFSVGSTVPWAEAAQAAGGDIRGQQSAAMLIVSGEQQQKAWHGRLFNLRVDDHPHPVEELKRLVSLRKAWLLFDQSNELALAQHFDEAMSLLRKAMELGPDITELKFRGSEILFRAGQVQEALALLREVFAREPIWAELIPRMAAVGLLPNDPALLKYILDQRS